MDVDRATWKISVVGPRGVGKSSLISRIVYDSDVAASQQRALVKKKMSLTFEGKKIIADLLFQELDGDEEVDKLLVGSNAIIVVADITNKKTIGDANSIIKYAINFEKKPLVILAGTKLDLKYEAEIWEEDFNGLKEDYGINYFLISSKNSQAVNELVEYLTTQLLDRFYKRKSDE